MITCIERMRFMGATPKRTMAGLRAATNPIRVFFKPVGAVRKVHGSPPQVLLGGDLAVLINQRLRQALTETGATAIATDDVRRKRTSITSPSPIHQETAFRPANVAEMHKPQRTRPSSDSFPGNSRLEEKREHANTTKSADGHFGGPDQPDIDRHHFAESNDDNRYETTDTVPDRIRDANENNHDNPGPPKTTLETKLQRYWALNIEGQRKTPVEFSVDRPTVEHASEARPQTFPVNVKPSSALWPDQVGQEVTAAIQAELSPGQQAPSNSHRGAGTSTTGLTINNSFKIDLVNKQSGNNDSDRDLSQKIADILRYQALQHGIDIT